MAGFDERADGVAGRRGDAVRDGESVCGEGVGMRDDESARDTGAVMRDDAHRGGAAPAAAVPAGDTAESARNDESLNEREVQRRCDALAAHVLEVCVDRGLKIAAAESLTGGLLADAFVRIPGASRVFLGSVVTYDIAAKASVLGVDRDLLQAEGAVHPDVARQMAAGTARLYAQPMYHGGVVGLSTTGVAGPGPDGGKPAGLVYVGIAMPAVAGEPERVEAAELRLSGDRGHIRRMTVLRVLENLSRFPVFSQE